MSDAAPVLPKTPQASVAGAMRGFAQEVGALSAFRLESCIHCGICADACHFYIATEDPQYTPIWKVEPFKQAYKREASPFAPLYRLFGLKRAITADQLEQWQHLLFDSCNMCGRCSLICPMGIDVAALIEQARHAMFDAGLAPKELYKRQPASKRPASRSRAASPTASSFGLSARDSGSRYRSISPRPTLCCAYRAPTSSTIRVPSLRLRESCSI